VGDGCAGGPPLLTAAVAPPDPRRRALSARRAAVPTSRLDGFPPCSRMERRTAAMSRSLESMASRSRIASSQTLVTVSWRDTPWRKRTRSPNTQFRALFGAPPQTRPARDSVTRDLLCEKWAQPKARPLGRLLRLTCPLDGHPRLSIGVGGPSRCPCILRRHYGGNSPRHAVWRYRRSSGAAGRMDVRVSRIVEEA
jgi:hypothetical protein